MTLNEAYAEAVRQFPEGCVWDSEKDGVREGTFTDSEGGQWHIATTDEQGIIDFGP